MYIKIKVDSSIQDVSWRQKCVESGGVKGWRQVVNK